MGDFVDLESNIENIPPNSSNYEPEYTDPSVLLPSFRCNARVFFLTYPRCPVPAGDALQLLTGLIGSRLEFICVGHELHKDGGDHLHVVFKVKVSWAMTCLSDKKINDSFY